MEQVKQKQKKNGFTLIELLVTLTIALVIGSIAIPGYQHSIRKGRRHMVQNQMLSLHLQQQHFYLSNQKYASEKDLTITTTKHYAVNIQQESEDDFIIVAKALASQQSGSGCDTMTINHDLIKHPKACW
jgi:type IV pilus assembly protein PilE